VFNSAATLSADTANLGSYGVGADPIIYGLTVSSTDASIYNVNLRASLTAKGLTVSGASNVLFHDMTVDGMSIYTDQAPLISVINDSDGVTFTEVTVQNGGAYLSSEGETQQFGGGLAIGAADNVTIQNSTFTDNKEFHIQAYIPKSTVRPITGVVAQYNTITSTKTMDLTYFEGINAGANASGMIIRGNTFSNIAMPIQSDGGCSGTTAYNNKITDCRYACLRIVSNDDADGGLNTGTNFFNNTAVSENAYTVGISLAVVEGFEAVNPRIENNIMVSHTAGFRYLLDYRTAQTYAALGNNIYHGSATPHWWYKGIDYSSFASYDSQNPGNGEQFDDPLLNADYTLQAGSPAIGRNTLRGMREDWGRVHITMMAGIICSAT
jgi:hypothetical protein